SAVRMVNEEPPAVIAHALAVNPNCADAHAMAGWLALESEDFEGAAKAVDRALAANPSSLRAIAVRAALLYLTDKKAELDGETRRALAINPKAGEFFDTLAHFAVNNRRYTEA